MTTITLFLLASALVLLLAYVPLLLWCRSHLVDLNRYELFRVRTQLVGLVAKDQIDPRDPTFQKLYELVNISIANTKLFTLSPLSLYAFTVASRDRDLGPRITSLLEMVLAGPPEIQKVAGEYFSAMATVMWRNSWLLRNYLRFLQWTRRGGDRIRKLLPWLHEAGRLEKSCYESAKQLRAAA